MNVRTVIKTWAYGAGEASKSQVTGVIKGLIVGLVVDVSSVTGTPSAAVTYRDADGCTIIPDALCATSAVGHNYYKGYGLAGSTDSQFPPVAVMGKVTVAIDPSAVVGASGETLTVKVRILYED